MEKIIAKKIEKNNGEKQTQNNIGKKSKESDLKKTKKAKKEKNKVPLFEIIKSSKKEFIINFVFTTIAMLLSFLTFFSNKYYDFIKRPKVVENSKIVLTLLCLFLVFNFAQFVWFKAIKQKSSKKPEEQLLENDKYNNKNISPSTTNGNLPSQNKKIIDITKQSFIKKIIKKIKLLFETKKKNANNLTEKIFLVSTIFAIMFNLSFLLKLLILTVFFSFFMVFCNIFVNFKQKNKNFLIFSIPNLVISICIFFSFYFVYMLN